MTGVIRRDNSAGSPVAAPRAQRVAVLIPCLDEEVAIAQVVRDFRACLPDAEIYVYDNMSTDRTAEVARQAGAIVPSELRKGKGHVVRRMFGDIDADIYVLTDGDGTYHAPSAPAMIQELRDGPYDMVTATRVASDSASYRSGHRLGNRVLTWAVSTIFQNRLSDMLSGFRVFSR